MKKIVFFFLIAVSVFACVSLTTVSLHAGEAQWKNICPDKSVSYCENVGKSAYNNPTNPLLLRDIKLGTITGVAWRPKGSVIGVSEASHGMPRSVHTSPRDAHYYIIDPGDGKSLLRECSAIDAK